MLEVDSGVLRVRDKAAAHSEAGVEVAACSKAEDEAAACSLVAFEDGKWRWCGSVCGDRRATARRFQKIAKCCKREHGLEILGHVHLMQDAPISHVSPFS
jgi:hypothetical protein